MSNKRYANVDELVSHHGLGVQHVRAVFHPSRPRTLLDRRVHRLLHIVAFVRLLSQFGQQSSAVSGRSQAGENLVPAVFLLREQHSQQGAQCVSMAAERFLPGLQVNQVQSETSPQPGRASSQKTHSTSTSTSVSNLQQKQSPIVPKPDHTKLLTCFK